MLRFDSDLRKRVENKHADAFIQEIIAVYKKHGMALSHEDSQGSFIVCPISDDKIWWLEQASVTSQKD